MQEVDYAAAQRVDYFIANSKTTAERIKKYYNRESEVIYPGVGDPKQGKVAPLPNPKMMIEQARSQVKMAELKQRQTEFMMTMQEEHMLNTVEIEAFLPTPKILGSPGR